MIHTTLSDIVSNDSIGAIKLGISRSQIIEILGEPTHAYRGGKPNSPLDKAEIWEYDNLLEIWFDEANQVHNISLCFKNDIDHLPKYIQLIGYCPTYSTTSEEFKNFLLEQNIEFDMTNKGVGFKVVKSNVLISFYDSFDEGVPNFIHKVSIRNW